MRRRTRRTDVRRAVLLWLLCASPAAAGSLDDFAGALAGHAPGGRDTAVRVRPRDAATQRVAQELGGLIVGRVDGAAVVDDEAGARRAGFAALLDVEVGVEAGEIVALGRVVSVERDLWREVLGMRGGTTSGFAVRAKLDGELRAWLGGAATPVTPTTAVARRWSFRPLAAPVELGSSLLALAAADLDADRRAELIALTVDEVLVLRVEAGAATVIARAPLDGPAPLPRPRVPAGALIAAGPIAARSSEHAAGGSYVWQNGALVRGGEAVSGYPTCAGMASLLPAVPILGGVPSLPERFLGVACAGDAVAVVEPGGSLRIARGGAPAVTVADVGTAFAMADLDGDGNLELVASSYRVAGTGDLLSVRRLADGRPLRRPTPTRDGVAGIAVGDLDADGTPDVVAATRLQGDTKAELWLLE